MYSVGTDTGEVLDALCDTNLDDALLAMLLKKVQSFRKSEGLGPMPTLQHDKEAASASGQAASLAGAELIGKEIDCLVTLATESAMAQCTSARHTMRKLMGHGG
jgi:hypothetical protein